MIYLAIGYSLDTPVSVRPEFIEGFSKNGSTQPSLFELWRAGWAFTPELAEGSPRTEERNPKSMLIQ
jgi:hypothetical protein